MQAARRCPKCGEQVSQEARFCYSCGSDISEPTPTQSQPPAQPPTQVTSRRPDAEHDAQMRSAKRAGIALAIIVAGIIGYAVGREMVKQELADALAEGFGSGVTQDGAPETPSSVEEPTPPPGTIRDGVWRIGTDIEPGTYRTTDSGCYWERMSGFGGRVEEIIANGNTTGPTVVTIQASDAGFTSSGGCVWEKT